MNSSRVADCIHEFANGRLQFFLATSILSEFGDVMGTKKNAASDFRNNTSTADITFAGLKLNYFICPAIEFDRNLNTTLFTT